MGNIEQLKDTIEPSKASEKYIKATINETEHMSQVIKDLLRVSELEK